MLWNKIIFITFITFVLLLNPGTYILKAIKTYNKIILINFFLRNVKTPLYWNTDGQFKWMKICFYKMLTRKTFKANKKITKKWHILIILNKHVLYFIYIKRQYKNQKDVFFLLFSLIWAMILVLVGFYLLFGCMDITCMTHFYHPLNDPLKN